MADMLIKGGTVVDGTGAKAFAADVRVRGEKIVEVGANLQAGAGERVVDAAGCIVAPGFIESHTHFDATMWWQPDMDPLPGYGVTTVIMGNCGFTTAPVPTDPKVREEVIGIFSFFEDIPPEPFKQLLPWDWSTWSEYKKSMTANLRTAANYGAYMGHIPLRLTVMGMDAWDRAATPDEIKKMAALLEDGLAAGALGLSSNLMDHDGQGRSVPSLKADEAEWAALMDVLERYPAATLQFIPDTFLRLTAEEKIRWLDGILGDRKIRVQIAGLIPAQGFQAKLVPSLMKLREELRASGKDIWAGYGHTPTASVINVRISLIFAQSGDFVWHEIVTAKSDAERERLLRDPDWRARARDSWDNKLHPQGLFRMPERLILFDSENGAGPHNIRLTVYAAELGVHPSDAMAEWFLRNGLDSTIDVEPMPLVDEVITKLFADPLSVGNISDTPAHGQMFCGAGRNMLLFTTYMKERGMLTLEEAVHVQTGKLAKHFNLNEIGEIKAGKQADIAVFNLDEIEMRDMYKIKDVPDGKGGHIWRWTRPAAPMRLTLVKGEPTFENGAFTGNLPGTLVSPAV